MLAQLRPEGPFVSFESPAINRTCGPDLHAHSLVWHPHLLTQYWNRLHSSSPVGLTTDIEFSYSDSNLLFFNSFGF